MHILQNNSMLKSRYLGPLDQEIRKASGLSAKETFYQIQLELYAMGESVEGIFASYSFEGNNAEEHNINYHF